jgi:hypothetical protein
MKIDRYEDHGQLQAGQLILDNDGKLWRVAKYRFGGDPEETWLEHFSDEYAFMMRNLPPDIGNSGQALGDDCPLPLTVVKVVPE